MPLETINYIPDLNTANPTPSDGLVQGDDHLRGIKTALRNTFPNFTDVALSATQAELDAVAHTKQLAAQNGSSGAPSITFANDATAGFYKGSRTGQTAIAGVLRGQGAMPVGAIVDFPKQPANFGSEWLECDGNTHNITDFPDLGAFLGNTFGGDGIITFGVPFLTDTGRYRRSRSNALGFAAGAYQANAFKSHTHTGQTNSAGAHTHGINDPGHYHQLNETKANVQAISGVLVDGSIDRNSGTPSGSTDVATTGITILSDGAHSHSVTLNLNTDGGGTETRPESFVVYSCIKT